MFCGTEWQSTLDAKFAPPPNLSARDRRAELYKKPGKSLQPHKGSLHSHLLSVKDFLGHRKQSEAAGTLLRRVQRHKPPKE